MRFGAAGLLAACFALAVVLCAAFLWSVYVNTTVFACKSVYGHQGATAIAVRSGKVVSVGSLGSLARHGRVDARFARMHIMPGLVDPMVSVVLSCAVMGLDSIVAPEGWPLPHASFPPADTPSRYLDALREHARTCRSKVCLSFGYYPPVHGALDRETLDTLGAPVVVWHRSCTSFFLSSSALRLLGEVAEQKVSGLDADAGVVQGKALHVVCPRLFELAGMRARMERGAERFRRYMTGQGVTTVGDVASCAGAVEWVRRALRGAPLTVRFSMRPHPHVSRLGYNLGTLHMMRERRKADSPGSNVNWAPGEQVLLQLDGPITAQAHQKKCFDSTGRWVYMQDASDGLCRWTTDRKGSVSYQVHGDFALDVCLSHLYKRMYARVQLREPRIFLDHSADVEDLLNKLSHLRAASMRVGISTCPALMGVYQPDVSPLGRLYRAGFDAAVHSSMPVGAPSDPLGHARDAAGVSRVQALHTVTSAAAAAIREETRTGSIVPARGMWADFCVTLQDPAETPEPEIWGVVHHGRPVRTKWRRSSPEAPAPPDEPRASVVMHRFGIGGEFCPVQGLIGLLVKHLGYSC